MDLPQINNFFGDMDLFLMDFLLKGVVPEDASILDVGCGEGRNAVYFIQQGFEYVGIDPDASKLRLVQYMVDQMKSVKASFVQTSLLDLSMQQSFDFIICSRVLHFCSSEEEFVRSLDQLHGLLHSGGTCYVAMDSVINNSLAKETGDHLFTFPDGKTRFALTKGLYEKTLRRFHEVEPLRTVIYGKERAQSFAFLRKP